MSLLWAEQQYRWPSKSPVEVGGNLCKRSMIVLVIYGRDPDNIRMAKVLNNCLHSQTEMAAWANRENDIVDN